MSYQFKCDCGRIHDITVSNSQVAKDVVSVNQAPSRPNLSVLEGIRVIIRAYKEAKNVPAGDQDWDNKHFTRHVKQAKELLNIFDGDHVSAAGFLIAQGQELDDNGLNWGLEAIIRASSRMHATIKERANANGTILTKVDAIGSLELGRYPRTAPARKEIRKDISGLKEGHKIIPDREQA